MTIGKLMIAISIALLVIGLIIDYVPGMLSWFGRLPGDIRVTGENKFFFFPITSMLIVSVLITIIVNVFFKR
ncbi:MAG: DUF2905 domain-containing protein [Methylococcales bacterium]